MKVETFQAIRQAYFKAKAEFVEEYSWWSLALMGFKLEAILKYRQNTNSSLKDAKERVESYLLSQEEA